METITVETIINAPIEKVWDAYTNPDAVKQWNTAQDDWHCPLAENDLREGGTFKYRMEAKDGSEGFDFTGTYTEVVPHEKIAYVMDDGRTVETTFSAEGEGVKVTTMFDPETVNPNEMQRAGWQAILENFKKYAESHS